jgi:predicted transcriptional regulator
MTEDQILQELLAFFKALSDANRLKIIGLLAREDANVEQIASALGISVSTTSHHLARLAELGLVSARVDGHYYFYSLQTDALRSMSEKLLKTEDLSRLNDTPVDSDSYDRKVLAAFLLPDGRIKAFPAQEKKFQAILRHVLKAFEPNRRYPEKEVNEILARFNDDTATLRRGLVEYHLMERAGGGGEYWLPQQ